MDAMRKQLDVPMGANRNGDVRELNPMYYDRDVCRLYLADLCPHELFQLTKMDMGPCRCSSEKSVEKHVIELGN